MGRKTGKKAGVMEGGGILAIVLVGNTLAPALANGFTPPKRGYPDGGITRGGGTRSTPTLCVDPASPPLAPLVPKTAMALTQAEYPRFFWFFPENTASRGEFRLFSVTNQGRGLWDDTLLYQTEFQISGESGIASLKLPDTLNLPPLEVGQPYRWYVSLMCNPLDPVHNITISGWVERSALAPQVQDRLEQLQGRDRAELFAQEGLWFDALETLADLRCGDPNNPDLLNEWSALLQDDDIALANLVETPLLQQCTSFSSDDLDGDLGGNLSDSQSLK